MSTICPDPAALIAWRNIMATTGGALLLGALLFIQVAVRARPSSGRLRLASGLSVALALGVGVASLILFSRLNGAFGQVARWFPYYPDDCTPQAQHYPPGYIVAIQRAAQQAVAPLERAAAIDLVVAVVALVALVACATRCVRAAAHDLDVTTVTLDS